MTPETPVQGRESARTLVHACCPKIARLCADEPTLSGFEHHEDCTRLTAAIATRDAAAEARERVYREALQPVAFAVGEPHRCGCCHWLLEKCIDGNCRGFVAREALKQGGL